MKLQDIEIKANWKYKQRDPRIEDVWKELHDSVNSLWNAVQSMPSEIHVELMKIGKIPDPYIGFNEHKVQWIGEHDWLYATTVNYDNNEDRETTELIFEGLDTFCDVYLNNKLIFAAENQFRTYRVTLDPSDLKTDNELLLHFKSAKRIGKEHEKKYGRVRAGSCNLGDPSRVYVRKAQYDWRWDWGPELLTVGPYRPVRLLTYTAHILDLHPEVTLTSSLKPSLTVGLTLRGKANEIETIRVILRDAAGNIVGQNTFDQFREPGITEKEIKVVTWEFEKGEVELWWPVGYGKQVLYELEVVLIGPNTFILDQQTKRFGFRKVELIQEPLTEADRYGKGRTFLFEVNNVRMFMGGSNWVPADSFLTTITPERYRAWLQLVRDGNQNMVRLWGGGVYEPDIFYDICDELGLLVWQDFQFACGVYPAHDAFVENVRIEAEQNVTRLRHHPSLALFCGNNEDYQQVLQWGDVPSLPARKIYEEVLPEVVTRLTGDRIPYHRGSPYGGEGWNTADPTIGDIHQWEVWAGQRVYHDYDVLGGRFISEFGMPAMPDMRTVNYWSQGADPKMMYAQSPLMAQHNKAGSHERRFAVAMNDGFRVTADLEAHIYNTQIMQSDALSFAYRSWRREWRGRGKEFTSGAIVWQINDCWPVTSWAIVDYFLRPKPAFYSIARELKPYTVGIARSVKKSRDCDRPRQFYDFGAFPCTKAELQVWGTNSTLNEKHASLVLSFFDLESEWTHEERRDVVLLPNQSTEILDIDCPEPSRKDSFVEDLEPRRTQTHTVVISARLFDTETGEMLSRNSNWPEPYRFIKFPDPGLSLKIDGEDISVTVQKPAKGVVFSVAGEMDVRWSDNNLDLVPGDEQVIIATGLDGKELRVAYMGCETAVTASDNEQK